MNQDVDGNRKLFWKEVNEGKEESCSRIKDGKGRIKPGADEVQRIWKDYFEDLHNRYSRAGCSPHVRLPSYSES